MWLDYVWCCLMENLHLFWCYSSSTSVRRTPVDVPFCELWYCFDSFLRDFRDFVSWLKDAPFDCFGFSNILHFSSVIWSHTCLRSPKNKSSLGYNGNSLCFQQRVLFLHVIIQNFSAAHSYAKSDRYSWTCCHLVHRTRSHIIWGKLSQQSWH